MTPRKRLISLEDTPYHHGVFSAFGEQLCAVPVKATTLSIAKDGSCKGSSIPS